MMTVNTIWLVVLLLISVLIIYLFYLYLKDRDKRKLMFSIAFFFTINPIIELSFGFITYNGEAASVFIYNCFMLSAFPFLIAVFIAAHEQILRVKNYDRVFYAFLVLSAISISSIFLPFKVIIIPEITRILLSTEILMISIYQFYKTRENENLYFIFYIVSIIVSIVFFQLNNEYFSAFAIIASNFFIILLFIRPKTSTNKKNTGIGSYFTIQQQLKTTEKRYEKLFNSIPDSINLLSADGTVLNLNDSMAKNFSRSKEEMIGKNIHNLLPKDIDEKRSAIGLKAFQTGQIQEDDDKRGDMYFHSIYVPIELENNQRNLMVIARDITNEKKMEKEREDKLKDLKDTELATLNIMEDMQETVKNLEKARQEILEKNEELEKTNQQLQITREQLSDLNKHLEQKVEQRTKEIQRLLNQKDSFIDQLGHDLKHPLGPFVLLLPILKKQEKDQKKLEIIDVMERNIGYMRHLVNQTVKLARLNAPSTAFKFDPVRFKEIMENIVEKNSSMINKFDVKITTDIDAGLILNADPIQLEEVMNNLLVNAVKYGADHGTISVSAEKQDEDYAVIRVKDSGQGLVPEQLELVFNEFYKADESRHDFTNTGLGLSFCKKIVEKHGGKIWAESKGFGKGSTFSFTMPLFKNK